MEVMDVHHHIGNALMRPIDWSNGFALDYERRTKIMDEYGIDKAVIMPSPGYMMPGGIEDTKIANNQVAEYRARYSSRFPIALGTVEPLHGEISIDEIDRIIKELHLNGIVWHHRFQGCYIDHPIMRLYLRRIAELGIPAFIHIIAGSGVESPRRLEILAQEFPTVTFVALDAFSPIDQAENVMQLARRQSNILFDTGVLVSLGRVVERFVRSFGSERLLFGSDLYASPGGRQGIDGIVYNYPVPLLEIEKGNMSETDKQNILGGNARRLFKVG